MNALLSRPDELPEDGRADIVLALGIAQRADGSPSLATRAVAERAVEAFARSQARFLVLSGGARVLPQVFPPPSSEGPNLPPGFVRAVDSGKPGPTWISEARAMRTVVTALGLVEEVVLDEADCHRKGTHQQPPTFADVLRRQAPGDGATAWRVILVTHPRHLPRALWLFRRALPAVRFYGVNAEEIYDPNATQRRLRGRGRFCLWNLLAWVHHVLFVARGKRGGTGTRPPGS